MTSAAVDYEPVSSYFSSSSSFNVLNGSVKLSVTVDKFD